MLEVCDPLYPNWDQDATALEERYDDQNPNAVISQLRSNASLLAERLEAISDDDWARKGRRSDGASFTIDSISRYMIHDPIHHLWDVTVSH